MPFHVSGCRMRLPHRIRMQLPFRVFDTRMRQKRTGTEIPMSFYLLRENL